MLDWIATARHPRFNRPYTELVYQPMLELLAYLRANGFKTFIVSGGGIEFMRPWTEKVYGIPPEQVVGSSGVVKFQIGADGKPVLIKLAKVEFIDDGPGKPVGINRFIGRRPIFAFGNSDGDLQMLQWTAAGDGARFMGIVHHTDAEREYAYDRQSQDRQARQGAGTRPCKRGWTRRRHEIGLEGDLSVPEVVEPPAPLVLAPTGTAGLPSRRTNSGGRHVDARYFRLDCSSHPRRKRNCDVFYRRFAARAYCKNSWPSVGTGSHHRRMGDVDLRLRVVASCADLGLCRCARSAQTRGIAMIVAIVNVYLVILFILVKMKIVPFNLFWKISPAIVLLLLLVGLFIPMGWGAPQGPAVVLRSSVAIVPDVAGEVIDVPVTANTPLKSGDVLFKIDPAPYQSQLDALAAQLKFEQLRLSQMTELQYSDSGRAFDVQQRQASVDQLKAQVAGAKWNLDKTVERAPSDGYVTNVGLRKGARVANLPLSPVMAFINTSETTIGVEIQQIYTRYIEPGQDVEVTFKYLPGQVFTGKVVALLESISSGQILVTGAAATTKQIVAAPFAVRVKLDDDKLAASLPAGTAGEAAIYTPQIKAAHLIRKVILRQMAILNYVNPF